MSVCVYCRVGNPEQLNGWVMDTQLRNLKRYAEANRLQIVKEVCEYGVGTTMARPGLQEIAEFVRTGQTDLVLIQNLSRLSRQSEAADAFLDLLHQHNVMLLSLSERLALPPHRKLNMELLASL